LNEFYNELINSDFKNKADEALLFFYNQVKEEAEKKYVEKLEEKTKNNIFNIKLIIIIIIIIKKNIK